MNILFVNYGQAGNNTTHHMAGFALAARRSGHEVAMAAPKGSGEWSLLDGATMPLTDMKGACKTCDLFANHQPPDIIHAFTPRESVREFVFQCFQHDQRAALAIHLEDNEVSLVERHAGQSIEQLAQSATDLGKGFIHPLRWRAFLALADRISVIYRTLGDFAPASVNWDELPPVLDAEFFVPRAIDLTRRRELGVPDDASVLCYTGNDHFANRDDVRELYTIIHALNQRGRPTRLLRTGKTDPTTSEGLGFDPQSFMTSLGFVDREELPRLMSLCDVFVQPGGDDAFNRYRLPAKVPEYLMLGKPVIVGPANLACELTHGVNAWIAGKGSVEEMIVACETLLADASLREKLGQGAREFALKRFTLEAAIPQVAAFYEACAATAKTRTGARGLGGAAFPCAETEASALSAFLRDRPAPPPVKAEKTSNKAAEELAKLKSSFAWKLAKPLHSIEKRLRGR